MGEVELDNYVEEPIEESDTEVEDTEVEDK